MRLTWLPGWERVTPTRTGGAIRVPGVPPRLVLHTDEVPTADMRRLYERHPWPPQLWGDPHTGQALQGISLDRSGYALKAVPGVETNHMGRCAQIELHARAADTPWWGDDRLALVGAWVDQICAAIGAPLVAWLPTRGPEAYGPNAPGRMTPTEWRDFSGVCLHQHVPGNHHWDAGAINLARIVEFARFWRSLRTSPAQPAPEVPVSDALTRQSFLTVVGTAWGVDSGQLIHGQRDVRTLPPLASRPDLEDAVRRILARIDEIPVDGTDAGLAQLVADRLDQIIAAVDGLVLDDGRPATGDDARRLIAELIGATIP